MVRAVSSVVNFQVHGWRDFFAVENSEGVELVFGEVEPELGKLHLNGVTPFFGLNRKRKCGWDRVTDGDGIQVSSRTDDMSLESFERKSMHLQEIVQAIARVAALASSLEGWSSMRGKTLWSGGHFQSIGQKQS